MSYTIIGVHGLANKPPRAPHELDWVKALTGGLQRNFNVSPAMLNFRLVYWADVMYQNPVVNEENQALHNPSIIRQWTKLADRRDPVAFDTHLEDDYEANDRGVAVRDDLIINDYKSPSGKTNSHKIYGYLRAPELSDVIRRFF